MKHTKTLTILALAAGCGGEMPPDTATSVSGLSTTFQQWTSSTSFQNAMTSPGAVVLTGDFDSNDRDDVAVLRDSLGGPTIGRAYNSQYSLGYLGGASFQQLHTLHDDLDDYVDAAQHFVVGDFDGDTFDDIALLGIPNKSSIPVIHGASGGVFTYSELPAPWIAYYATSPGAQVVAGDFNGDGKDDIAMTGGSNWSSIVLGYSTGTSLALAYEYEPNFLVWSQQPGAQLVAGDFDGDGDGDLALVGGASFSSVAFARSNGGGFTVTTAFSPNIVVKPKAAGARLMVGDYDGDGDDDFAVVGAPGETRAYFTFCDWGTALQLTDDSSYQPFFASYATSTNGIMSGRLSHDTRDDLYYPSAQNYSLHALLMGSIRGG